MRIEKVWFTPHWYDPRWVSRKVQILSSDDLRASGCVHQKGLWFVTIKTSGNKNILQELARWSRIATGFSRNQYHGEAESSEHHEPSALLRELGVPLPGHGSHDWWCPQHYEVNNMRWAWWAIRQKAFPDDAQIREPLSWIESGSQRYQARQLSRGCGSNYGPDYCQALWLRSFEKPTLGLHPYGQVGNTYGHGTGSSSKLGLWLQGRQLVPGYLPLRTFAR